jgi:ABC-type uncharacterized transport system substrate-binding protein
MVGHGRADARSGRRAGPHEGRYHLRELFDRGRRWAKNIVLERRFGENKAERISEVGAELVRIKVDVIVTATDVGIAAVKRQTQTIPVVMANSTDPVETGFVASLARPGGNVTGLSMIAPELSGKRLELLREVVPGLSRVAIMWDPDVRGAVLDYKETERAARSLRLLPLVLWRAYPARVATSRD